MTELEAIRLALIEAETLPNPGPDRNTLPERREMVAWIRERANALCSTDADGGS